MKKPTKKAPKSPFYAKGGPVEKPAGGKGNAGFMKARGLGAAKKGGNFKRDA